MSNKFIFPIVFAAGAAIGSVVTWQFAKKKYEQIIQEEIDSVKETYSKKNEEPVEEKSTINFLESESKIAYGKFPEGTIEENDSITSTYSEREEFAEEPYVIPPEEFGEADGYSELSFTFYADQILTDENDRVIEDVDRIVGVESLNHFGEYEEDAIHVRNERLRCDYEILLDPRKYDDVLKENPYLQMVFDEGEDDE